MTARDHCVSIVIDGQRIFIRTGAEDEPLELSGKPFCSDDGECVCAEGEET